MLWLPNNRLNGTSVRDRVHVSSGASEPDDLVKNGQGAKNTCPQRNAHRNRPKMLASLQSPAVMVRWVINAMPFAMFFAFLALFAVKLRWMA